MFFLTIKKPNSKERYSLLGLLELIEEGFFTLKVIVPYSKQELFSSFFEKGKSWNYNKLANISSYQKEWMKLINLENLFLKKYIMNPKMYKNESVNYLKLNKDFYKKLKSNYNDHQLGAIKCCLKKKGITLLQILPGTGKNKTIVGILNGLFSSESEEKKNIIMENVKRNRILKKNSDLCNKWKENYKKVLKNNFENLFKKRSLNEFLGKEKVVEFDVFQNSKERDNSFLICGVNNYSIDEIILTLLSKKLFNKKGVLFLPKMVKLGETSAREVDKIGLDFLTKKYLIQNPKNKNIDSIQNKIIMDSNIIFTTLNYLYNNDILKKVKKNFETVILDESCKMREISSLFAINSKTERLILLGDPSTSINKCFSKLGQKLKFSRDLFTRLRENKFSYYNVKLQYKIDPRISKFISSIFYKNKLLNDDSLKKSKNKFAKLKSLSPYSFINIEGEETEMGQSFKNEKEAEAIIKILQKIKKSYKKYDLNNIKILSPYREQIYTIRNLLKKNDFHVNASFINDYTVKDREVVIFSSVRSNKEGNIGFMHNKKILNFCLSQANSLLIMIGNSTTLKKNHIWKNIITYCEKNKKYAQKI